MAKTKLDPEQVARRYEGWTRKQKLRELENLQVAVYVAAGGGMIGRMYAEQPADAYVDTRAGRRPYPMGTLENMVLVMVVLAKLLKLDPHALPLMPQFHNCGTF